MRDIGTLKVHYLGQNINGSHVVFQNEAKNSPRQAVVMMNISCKCLNFYKC